MLGGIGFMKKTWSQKSQGTVPLNFLLHVHNCTKWKPRCHSLSTENYIQWLNLLKSPSPPPPHTHKWRKYILRGGGGISRAVPRKCYPLAQVRRDQKKAWSSSTCLLYGTDPTWGGSFNDFELSRLSFAEQIRFGLALAVYRGRGVHDSRWKGAANSQLIPQTQRMAK